MITQHASDVAGSLAIRIAGEHRLGLGCMALTGIYGDISREDAIGVLHEALDCGVTLFDTAALYGDGANEELLGNTIGEMREVSIVTKFGLHAASDGKLYRDSSPDAIRRSVDASLRRLKRDRLDFVLQHRSDPLVPFEEVLSTVAELKAEGKVGDFGVSNVAIDEIARCAKMGEVVIFQNELSLVTGAKADEVAAVEGAKAVFMAFAPLGRGLVTGSVPAEEGDYRRTMPCFRSPPATWLDKVGNAVTSRIANYGIDARSAIDWVLDQSPAVVAIPGCKSRRQVRDVFRRS